jgi:hypothetical protein
MSHTTTHKFVIALNKQLDPGIAMNAVAHIALSLMERATTEQRKAMQFIDYVDSSNIIHPTISALSLIIMRATPNELRKLSQSAQNNGLLHADFINTMTGNTYVEQLAKTKITAELDLVYYGVGVFADKETLNPLTKKLSLWKSI